MSLILYDEDLYLDKPPSGRKTELLLCFCVHLDLFMQLISIYLKVLTEHLGISEHGIVEFGIIITSYYFTKLGAFLISNLLLRAGFSYRTLILGFFPFLLIGNILYFLTGDFWATWASRILIGFGSISAEIVRRKFSQYHYKSSAAKELAVLDKLAFILPMLLGPPIAVLVEMAVKRNTKVVIVNNHSLIMDSTTIPSLIIIVLSLIAFFLFLFFGDIEDEKPPRQEDHKHSFLLWTSNHRAPAPAIFLLVLGAVIQTIFGSIVVFLPAFPLVFFSDTSFNQMQYILLILPFFIGFSYFLTEMFLKFFREKTALVASLIFLMMGCGLGFAGTSKNLFAFVASVAAFAIGVGIHYALQTPLLIRFLPTHKQELILHTASVFGLAGNYLGSFWITVTFRSKTHLIVSSIGLIGMTGVAIIVCIVFFVKLDPDAYFQDMRQVSAHPLLVVEENDDNGY